MGLDLSTHTIRGQSGREGILGHVEVSFKPTKGRREPRFHFRGVDRNSIAMSFLVIKGINLSLPSKDLTGDLFM